MTCSTAVTPDSPVTDSLIMGDEHLDIIPETESDEFIKSSVEDLVPTPIESEELSDGECDMPLCDDSITFSNPLFDANDDSTNSDDESFSKKDTSMKNFKIFSNLFFDLDDEIVSTKVGSIDDEVFEYINSIPPGIDPFDAESDLLESMLNRDISIDSSPKIDSLLDEFADELTFLRFNFPPNSLLEEIDNFLAPDDSLPPGIESDDFDSENDDSSTSTPEFESFHGDYPDLGDSTIDAVEDIPDCPDCEALGFSPIRSHEASNPQLHFGNPDILI
ncbi:hypothetical protein Tco_0757138 [Tanacetum coccineum]